MRPLSCAFFGHSDFLYDEYRDRVKERIVDLINRGVTIFYNGFRGNFDRMCAHIVSDLREQYPNIKNVLVLSYRNTKIDYPEYFDETVYLLDRPVPFKFAISKTNRKLVEIADYIISGVTRVYGGARKACNYAEKLYRTIFYVVQNYSFCDYDWVAQDCEILKNMKP